MFAWTPKKKSSSLASGFNTQYQCEGSEKSDLMVEILKNMSPIESFLEAKSFAVAGASRDREKYGNLILRKLLSTERIVFPINPHAKEIESQPAFPNLAAMPVVPEAVSIVTPPLVTGQIVAEAIRLGVKHLWMQPGAENPSASELARTAGINVIDDGSCILVALALLNRGRKNV